MAKYIILNGKVYNIKWPKKLYYFDKTLIAKKYSSGIWSETELKMSLNHSKCRMILFLFIILYQRYTESTEHKQYTCHNHHVALYRTYKRQYSTACYSCYNLRYTDCAVEQSEVSSLMSITLKSIGYKGEWHGKHGSPSATDKHKRNNK